VADQQQGTAQFRTEATQLLHHLPRHSHIQACGGLIGDQQRWLEGNGQGDRQALTHAATQFMGIGPAALHTDAHPLQQLIAALTPPAGAAVRAMGVQRVLQMSADRHQRIQTGHRVLEHQPCRLPAQPAQAVSIQAPRVLASESQPAFTGGSRWQQLHHRPGHRAFATS